MQVEWSETAEQQAQVLRNAYVLTDMGKVREVAERKAIDDCAHGVTLLREAGWPVLDLKAATVLPGDVRDAFRIVTGIAPDWRDFEP